MRARVFGWVVVAAVILAGCAIGPDYKRPVVAAPETFRGQATGEARSFADAPWWEAFQDPVLKGLIQEALRNNYDAAIAAAGRRRFRPSGRGLGNAGIPPGRGGLR